MKRLSIFLDGTWNDPTSDTNVTKLARLVADRGVDGAEQVKPYYDAGGRAISQRSDVQGGVNGAALMKERIMVWRR